jgi:hypothetical protein
MDELKFLNNRVDMFRDPETFWGRNRMELIHFCDISDFPDEAFHAPQTIQEGWIFDYAVPYGHRVVLLKRRYLNKLRQKVLKMHRCNRDSGYYVGRYWQQKNAKRLQNHIEYHQKQWDAAHNE